MRNYTSQIEKRKGSVSQIEMNFCVYLTTQTTLSFSLFVHVYLLSHWIVLIFWHRRTSGGVFLTLLKSRYVTKEQSKWIFAIENELLKKKAKEQQQRMKERQKQDVTDLRLKLQQQDKE